MSRVETGNIENGSFAGFLLDDPCNGEHKNRTMVDSVRPLGLTKQFDDNI